MKRKAALVLLLLMLSGQIGAADVIRSWRGNKKTVALTFDDGPHPQYTQEILDILGEYGVHATFFVIGENAERHPELVEAEEAAGHEIGNHTYSHRDLCKLTDEEIRSEIDGAERILYEDQEIRTRLLRPPGGNVGPGVCRIAAERDYTVVCWSVDTRDWAHTPTDKIVQNVLSSVKEGDIILFHDYVVGDSPTPAALRLIIPKLLDEGYRFVTVSELLYGS